MDVGIVVHRYDAREGTGGYVVRLLPHLARHHRITLYAARVDAPVPEGVTVVRVPAVLRRAYTAILSFPIGFRAVRRSHDIVHAQGWVTGEADLVTAHFVMAAWRRALRRIGEHPARGERLFGPLIEGRERRLLGKRARHVIAPSAMAARQLAEYYGRTDGVSVVPHGFPDVAAPPSRPQARRRLGLPADLPVALYVGDPRKGLDVALAAVLRHPSAHLAVASHTPTQRLVLHPRVHHLGSLAAPEDAYAAADVLLHPTPYDTFALVVAEAMAYGLPAVVTDRAGITELMRHGESGWIVTGDALEGTAAGLRTLLDDAPLREAIAAAARTVARRRGWEIVARETLAVYQRLAGP